MAIVNVRQCFRHCRDHLGEMLLRHLTHQRPIMPNFENTLMRINRPQCAPLHPLIFTPLITHQKHSYKPLDYKLQTPKGDL